MRKDCIKGGPKSTPPLNPNSEHELVQAQFWNSSSRFLKFLKNEISSSCGLIEGTGGTPGRSHWELQKHSVISFGFGKKLIFVSNFRVFQWFSMVVPSTVLFAVDTRNYENYFLDGYKFGRSVEVCEVWSIATEIIFYTKLRLKSGRKKLCTCFTTNMCWEFERRLQQLQFIRL